MDKQSFDALTVLMQKLEAHVIHATYQEDAEEAYISVKNWMNEWKDDEN